MSDAIAELPGWARQLLERSRVARLGLIGGDAGPRVLPVTFALCDGCAWTAVDRKPKRGAPARIGYLRRRPRVALTVDHYSEDWDALAWVQLLGTASLLPVAERPDAIAALRARYEPYRREPPPGPLIRIEPDRALSWRASSRES